MQINHIFFPFPYTITPSIRNNYTDYIAKIDEENCIGCMKCINKCPADAIIGAKKMMHIIIENYCTGCSLCTSACPTDCISMEKTAFSLTPQAARQRYLSHLTRLNAPRITLKQEIKPEAIDPRKQAVADAILRAQQKRQQLKSMQIQKQDESK